METLKNVAMIACVLVLLAFAESVNASGDGALKRTPITDLPVEIHGLLDGGE